MGGDAEEGRVGSLVEVEATGVFPLADTHGDNPGSFHLIPFNPKLVLTLDGVQVVIDGDGGGSN